MTRRFADLHTHSNASDGVSSPAELVRMAEAAKLAAVALTDHDTIAGLAEARLEAAKYEELRFVAGIEASAVFVGGTLHILGLGIDEASPAMIDMCSRLRAARDERNPVIVAKLQAMGLDITWDDVLAECVGRPSGTAFPGCAAQAGMPVPPSAADEITLNDKGIVGRLHIAQAMRRKGIVKTISEAFDKYIGQGGQAFVDKEHLLPRRIIQAIHDAGGVAVLAHPPQLHYKNLAQLERIVRDLIHDGIDGIEAYHSDNTDEQTRQYLDLARRFGLAVTGGSDFHGPAKPNVQLGHPAVPISMLDEKWQRIIFRGE